VEWTWAALARRRLPGVFESEVDDMADRGGGHRLGWLGTGRMGVALIHRLLDAGCDVTVYNRTRGKAEPLAAAGAKIASTAQRTCRAARSHRTEFIASPPGSTCWRTMLLAYPIGPRRMIGVRTLAPARGAV